MTTKVSTSMLNQSGNLNITAANVSLGPVANVHITGGTAGQSLITDGAGNLSFGSAALPTQTNNSGKYLTTDGTNASWGTVSSTPADGSITPAMLAFGNSAITLSSGTTEERPSSPVPGMIRYNSASSSIEAYLGSAWITVAAATLSITYVAVAGGGSGNAGSASVYEGGGAGAGGYLTNTAIVSPGLALIVAVGAGGTTNASGANSTLTGSGFTTVTAVGGGYGGTNSIGGTGGSGGSGAWPSGAGAKGIYPGSTYINAARQGYDGGAPNGSNGAGGGGGAGGAGQTGANGYGGNGGIGVVNPITGSTSGQLNTGVYYLAGGGGGATGTTAGGAGGLGGGGAGGFGLPGTAGTVNTGGGGGGGGASGSRAGGLGGSGVVIISYSGSSQRATGGTVTSSGSGAATVWVHTFTTSGTFTVS